jgi:DNA repair protein RadC
MDKDTIREKIAAYGCNIATDEELLGLFTGETGVLTPPGSIIENIAKKNVQELMLIYRITKVQALNLKAALEIGRRVFFPGNNKMVRLDSPSTAARYLIPKISFQPDRAVLCVVAEHQEPSDWYKQCG